MRLYIDTDLWMALIRQKDRFHISAKKWMSVNKEHELVTSTVSCLELWFYLYREKKMEIALEILRSIEKLATVITADFQDMERALILAEDHGLSPADALHALLALKHDAIVSTDHSFDKIPKLKRINFMNS